MTHTTSDLSASFLADPFVEQTNSAANDLESVIFGYEDDSIPDNTSIEIEMICLQSGAGPFFPGAGGVRILVSSHSARYTQRGNIQGGNIQVNIDQNVVPMLIHERAQLQVLSGDEFNRRDLLSLVLVPGTPERPV